MDGETGAGASSEAVRHLLAPRRPPDHRYGFIGVPHDAATTLGNPGARFGPQALREAMRSIFDWRLEDGCLADIDHGTIDLGAVEVVDLGDLPLSYHDTDRTVQETYGTVLKALEAGYTPLVVGGDHGVTYPAVKAVHDSCADVIGLIQLDAHCDLMDGSRRQGRFSGSSGMRRALELDRLAATNLVQVGLRGYTTVEQYEIGHRLGVHRVSARRFSQLGPQAAANEVLARAGDGTAAIYVSVDLDVFEPGQAPGTGWPEPGGLTAQQVFDFLSLVAPHAAALDIAELNPVYDSPAHTTTVLAARLMLDFIVARTVTSSAADRRAARNAGED